MNKLIDDIIRAKAGSGAGASTIILQAESHTTKEGQDIPVLTDTQITDAYNGVVAGNNVFIVDDLSTATTQVLESYEADEISIRLLYLGKFILQYKLGGEILVTPLSEAITKALEISDLPSDDKITTEKAIYNYIASGNNGLSRQLNTVNLNSIEATGFYACTSCTNRPVENNGVMIVINSAVSVAALVQIYFSFATDEMWVRHNDNNVWKNWVKVIKSGDSIPYDNSVSGLTAADVQGAIDEIATATPEVEIVSLTDPDMTLDALSSMLDDINNAGRHVFFDTAALGYSLYLCTFCIEEIEGVKRYRVNDLVSGKLALGPYVATKTIGDILSEAISDYYNINVTCLTQDGVIVTGQTVTLRQGQEPDSPVYQEKAYEGQPISFSVPRGFEYYVSVSDNLAAHFAPTTANGIVRDASVNVVLIYSDVSSITTFDGVIAGLTRLEDPTVMTRGVEIHDTWTADDGTIYDDPLFVADVRNVVDENGDTHLAAIMQRKWTVLNSIPFDPGEQEEAKEDTEPVALANIFYYGQSTEALTTTTLLSLSEGDPIPYSSYYKIFKNSLKDRTGRLQRSGHNRWATSFYRQYLNSDAPKGEYYEQKHIGQVKPSQADSLRGYMAGCSQELLLKVKPIKISCYLNSVTDGSVVEETLDTFWLPSGTEMYGLVNENEGTYFPYWKQATGAPAPFNNDSNYNKYRRQYAIENHSRAQGVYLRSADRTYSYFVWNCAEEGRFSHASASAGIKGCPACAIW